MTQSMGILDLHRNFRIHDAPHDVPECVSSSFRASRLERCEPTSNHGQQHPFIRVMRVLLSSQDFAVLGVRGFRG